MNATDYGKSTVPLSKVILDLPPSCVEFAPRHDISNPHGNFFVVGTYELQKEEFDETKKSGPQSRNGSLILFKLENAKATQIDFVQTGSAVLDLHFIPGRQTFAATDSTGGIKFVELAKNSERDGMYLKELCYHQVFPVDDEVLILSFTWYPHGGQSPPSLGLTLSTGAIHVIRFTSWDFNRYLTEHGPIHEHTQKAECCAWSPYSSDLKGPATLFTGGDDVRTSSLLIAHLPHMDSNVEFDLDQLDKPFAPKMRPHESGLTAILPLLGSDFSNSKPMLLTGGYDGFVKVYAPLGDVLSPSEKPDTLAELEIGGGVWKLKLMHNPISSEDDVVCYQILASCMHAGARILEVTYRKPDWKIKVLGDVQHDLNYASDFQPPSITTANTTAYPQRQPTFNQEVVCISTSFYDRLLSVWKFDPEVTYEHEIDLI